MNLSGSDFGLAPCGRPYLTLRFDAAPALALPVDPDHSDAAIEAGRALVEAVLGHALANAERSDFPGFGIYALDDPELVASG